MAAAAIRHKKVQQRSNAFDIGTINYGTTVARASHQARPSKDAEV
jgi:hypothetical protein